MPAVERRQTRINCVLSTASKTQDSVSSAYANSTESNSLNVSDFDYDNNNNDFDNGCASNDGNESDIGSMRRGSARRTSSSSQPSLARAAADAASSSSSSSQPRQGLGIEARKMAAIGQMGLHPWFILNRSLCAWKDGDGDEAMRYAIRKCAGVEGIKSRNLLVICNK